MKFDGMKPAPPVTRTRLATGCRLRVWHTPGPRTMARDFKRSPVRVVIVDDHRLFVDALALLLGHDDRLDVIGTAGDGPSAIELVVEKRAEVAVIDVRMPEVDGLETARRLRARSPETSVILVSGLDEPTLMQQAREAGDRKSTHLNSSHSQISYAVFCLKKNNKHRMPPAFPGTAYLYSCFSPGFSLLQNYLLYGAS